MKHSALEKQCAAASGRKRKATEAELTQQQRAAQLEPAPERNAGEDTIAGVVGKKVQGSQKFVLWEKDGELLADQCTWEPGAGFNLVPSILLNQTATFKLGQTMHKGEISLQHETELSKFHIKFESRRLSDRWVDLELPGLVRDGDSHSNGQQDAAQMRRTPEYQSRRDHGRDRRL